MLRMTRGIFRLTLTLSLLASSGVVVMAGPPPLPRESRSPAPVVRDTVIIVVHDTTIVRDTLTQMLGSVPDFLDVRVHDTINGKDWMTWIFQLLVALGAAFLGAWLGGRTARQAATAAIREEWETEKRYALKRLQNRVASNLRRVQLLSDRCANHDVNNPFDPDVGEELEVIWNLYYRVAEPIFTMGADDLSERLDAFFVKAHTLAETIKALEARARDVEMQTLGDASRMAAASNAQMKLAQQRITVLAKIADLGAEATQLLSEVRSVDGSVATPTTPSPNPPSPAPPAGPSMEGHPKTQGEAGKVESSGE